MMHYSEKVECFGRRRKSSPHIHYVLAKMQSGWPCKTCQRWTGSWRGESTRSLKCVIVLVLSVIMVGVILAPSLLSPFPEDDFPSTLLTSLSNVTIVTAYFDLGDLPKKHGVFPRLAREYWAWAEDYAFLLNPVILYTDSDHVADMFRALRRDWMNRTVIVKIDRRKLWPFKMEDQIQAIYEQPNYPKFYPNTVMPEYTCTQHAKYACLEHSLEQQYFRSAYIAWMDIGYFRNTAGRRRHFVIVPPRDFDKRKVAVNIVYPSSMAVSADEVFRGNMVWVGGGMVFGTQSQMALMAADYRRAVEHFLALGLSNTDQQVLYAMNLPDERKRLSPRVELQTYFWRTWPWQSRWFHLGYSCYREVL